MVHMTNDNAVVSPSTKYPVVGVRMTPEQIAEVDETAERRGFDSRSAAIKAALADWLHQEDEELTTA